jgi:hypothetical protein
MKHDLVPALNTGRKRPSTDAYWKAVATTLLILSATDGSAQTSRVGSASVGVVTVVPVAPHVIAPQGGRNSLGWNTGYSAITTTSERPNIFGRTWGGSDTVQETTTRVVPNDALGNPVRGGFIGAEPNGAGWNTGYSVVTSTYDRPNPLGAYLGGSRTVTETTTQVVPNNALGQPMRALPELWP